MRVAYLVTAYNDVPLLNRLLGLIVASGARAFVHMDLKSAHLRDDVLKHPNVSQIGNPLSVHWGGSGLCEAIVRLVETALQEGGFDYVHCMSGSDLPVRPLAEFEAYLSRIHPRSVLNARAVDPSRFEDRKRISAPYFLTERTRLGLFAQSLVFLWGAYVAPRRLPGANPLHFGNSWFTVTAETARFVARAWRTPEINAFYRRTYCADEMFFPTYIAAAAGEADLCRDRLRYIVWTGSARPKTLTVEDADAIAASGCYFARKFDSEASRALIARLGLDAP